MAQPIPTSHPHRNGVAGDHPARASSHGLGADKGPVTGVQDLLARFGSSVVADPAPEVESLREENARLRTALSELEAKAHSGGADPSAEEKLKEYEGLLEEKSEVIRELHCKLQQQADRPAGETPREEELLALSEELERERRQLKEDEESLMQQMREMEVQMARERAEMARQRNEMQRLQHEIRHELELAARDAALRERLAPLQRRAQEMLTRRGGAGGPAGEAPVGEGGGPRKEGRKDSGLFRRLFG